MRLGRAAVLFVLLLIVGVAGRSVSGIAQTQTPLAFAPTPTECGTAWNDWVCRKAGRVTVWPGAEADVYGGVAVRRQPRSVPGGSTVRVEPGAEASIRFRRKAHCDLGPSGTQTQIVTRVSPATLFRQTAGYTDCRSLNGSFLPAGFFCDATGECPVIFSSEGRYELDGPDASGAHMSSNTESRAVITACTKRFVLWIFDGEKLQKVERAEREPMSYRIEVYQRSETSAGGSRSTWGYSFSGVSAIC